MKWFRYISSCIIGFTIGVLLNKDPISKLIITIIAVIIYQVVLNQIVKKFANKI